MLSRTDIDAPLHISVGSLVNRNATWKRVVLGYCMYVFPEELFFHSSRVSSPRYSSLSPLLPLWIWHYCIALWCSVSAITIAPPSSLNPNITTYCRLFCFLLCAPALFDVPPPLPREWDHPHFFELDFSLLPLLAFSTPSFPPFYFLSFVLYRLLSPDVTNPNLLPPGFDVVHTASIISTLGLFVLFIRLLWIGVCHCCAGD